MSTAPATAAALRPAVQVEPLPPVQPAQDPDVLGNFNYWREYDWSRGGDEWSDPWGGTDNLWHGTLLPRLHRFLACAENGHILEIGCGFGRITDRLRRHCRRLTAVDLTPRCVEHCRQRFAADSHVSVAVNDGVSLPMVEDGSVDLAVSWDSLVHTSQRAVSDYLAQLAVKLRPGGCAFLHHSNLGVYADKLHGDEPGWIVAGRRKSQTAAKVREDCKRLGLRCLSQELIPWGATPMLIDCITVLTRDPAGAGRAPVIIERHDWREEVAHAARIGAMYRVP